MLRRIKTTHLFLIFSILTVVFALPSAGAAQQTPSDPRWRPWLGCWAMNDKGSVCIVPSASATAVGLVTLSAGKEVYREIIDASGEQKDRIFESCDGWESGLWADDGRRLYLRSEYRCGNGSVRTGNELFAISPAGEWIDSISVTVDGNTGVRTTRRRVVPRPDAMQAEFAGLVLQRPAPRTDTIIPPISFAEIVEASRLLDGPVVEAWLSLVKPQLKVDSRRLMDLSRGGVPEGVIDMLVALAYPELFSIEPAAPAPFPPSVAARVVAPSVTAPVVTQQVVIVEPIYEEPVYVRHPGENCQFDSYHWDRCDGWRPPREVVVINSGGKPVAPPPPHGRVTKEAGYQSGETVTKSEPVKASSDNADTNSKTETKADSKNDSKETTPSNPPPADPPAQRTARPR
jgi:hypothetical protein